MGGVAEKKLAPGGTGFIDAQVLEAEVIRLQDSGATVVLVERSGVLLGAVGVRDELRSEVPNVELALDSSLF